ncbi:MAG: hypothetical protein FWF57_00175 [Defluviitaleaceae bacterium]|nr:hypothetical protein [Defluviitaleaceae bacterium]
MQFQKEYEILTSINRRKMLEISYKFKNAKIKIYYNNQNFQALILICDINSKILLRNLLFYKDKNNIMCIDGHWGKYHKYLYTLSDDGSLKGNFNNFYNKLRCAIYNRHVQ